MEMTFPHPVSPNERAPRTGHRAMLAAAVARQAKSRTVLLLSLASNGGLFSESFDDAIERRIHYFASNFGKNAPFGPFWATHPSPATVQGKYKKGVYHDASNNSKANDIIDGGTGEQFNHAGHGALRTL